MSTPNPPQDPRPSVKASGGASELTRLIATGELQAAEQRLLRVLPGQSTARKAAIVLQMARAWLAAADVARTRKWLTRLPQKLPAPEALDAARLAVEVQDCMLTFEVFEQAAEAGAQLNEQDCLAQAQAALEWAERMRIPMGRQGSWKKHLILLKRADVLFAQLSLTASDTAIADAASKGRERTAVLLAPKMPRR